VNPWSHKSSSRPAVAYGEFPDGSSRETRPLDSISPRHAPGQMEKENMQQGPCLDNRLLYDRASGYCGRHVPGDSGFGSRERDPRRVVGFGESEHRVINNNP